MATLWQIFPPPNRFYLKPFGKEDIKKVSRKHDKRKFCYIEKYVKADGWKPTTHGKHNEEGIVENIPHET